MIERKIYSDWAFYPDEEEKHKMNQEIYNELIEKYKVYHGSPFYLDYDLSDYDIAIYRAPHYNHKLFRVLKNKPQLSELELALLCDEGNLSFGYTIEPNGDIYIEEA